MSEKDLSKLPIWARREIERLEANVESMEKRLAAMDSGDTKIKARFLVREVSLPDDAIVTFSVGDGRVEICLDGKCLQVRSCSNVLSIEPLANNTVSIVTK